MKYSGNILIFIYNISNAEYLLHGLYKTKYINVYLLYILCVLHFIINNIAYKIKQI